MNILFTYLTSRAKQEATGEQYSEFGEEEEGENAGQGQAGGKVLNQHGNIIQDREIGGGYDANVSGIADSEQAQDPASHRNDDVVEQKETRRHLESENGVEQQRGSEETTAELKVHTDENDEGVGNVDSAGGAESTESELNDPGHLAQDTASSRDTRENQTDGGGEEVSISSMHREAAQGGGVESNNSGELRDKGQDSVESGYRSASFEGDGDSSVRRRGWDTIV